MNTLLDVIEFKNQNTAQTIKSMLKPKTLYYKMKNGRIVKAIITYEW